MSHKKILKYVNRFDGSLDSRLACRGEFDFLDSHCRDRCAISIRCAMVKNDILKREIFDEDAPYDRAFVISKNE